MKNQLLCISVIIFVLGTLLGIAQEQKLDSLDVVNGTSTEYKALLNAEIEVLNEKHNRYAAEQKTELKEWVELINKRIDNGELSNEKGQLLKQERANQIAARIAAHRAKTDAEIEFAKVRGNVTAQSSTIEVSTKNGIKVDVTQNHRENAKYVRTYSGFSLSFGYNFMNGDRLSIHDFSYPNNNYFAIGYKWKTTLDKDKNNFRLVYGVEYQTHGTQLNGLRYFSQGDPTVVSPLSDILENGSMVRKAKFRQDQIVFPLHLEIGGADRKEYEDGRVRFREDGKFRVGLGGFVGFNTSSRLKLKYELDGRDIKETRINNFDNETFLYGVDAYLGWEDITFFGRLNLNNVFKTGSENAQYVAFGIRIQ